MPAAIRAPMPLRYLAEQSSYATAAFRHPSLRMLLIAYFGYCLVRKSARVAILVYAFDLGGVRAASLVAVVQLIPAALLAPLGSALAARSHPVRALAVGYLVQGLALAATGASMLLQAPLVTTAAASAVATAAFTLTRPVHLATLPDIVNEPQELTLGNASSAWMDGVASLLGPLLTAIGLHAFGAAAVLFALAVVAAVSGLAARRVVVLRDVARRSEPLKLLLTAGPQHLLEHADTRRLVLLVSAQYAVVGLLDVLLVVLAVDVMGADSSVAALLAAGIGAGAVLGAFASVALGGRQQMRGPLGVGALLTGIPLVLLGLGPGLVLALGLLTGYGIGKSVFTVSAQTLLQRIVPDGLSTRVFGLQEGLIQAGTALGSALGSVLVGLLGARWAIVATGALLPVAVLASLPVLGRLDSRARVPGAAFALLRAVPFLSMLPVRPLEQLARGADPVTVTAGRAVVREGEAGTHYYIISTGRAAVQIEGDTVRELRDGDGFGEIALLHDVTRTASIVAISDLQLLSVDRDGFLDALTGTGSAQRAAHSQATGYLEQDADRRLGRPADPE